MTIFLKFIFILGATAVITRPERQETWLRHCT